MKTVFSGFLFIVLMGTSFAQYYHYLPPRILSVNELDNTETSENGDNGNGISQIEIQDSDLKMTDPEALKNNRRVTVNGRDRVNSNGVKNNGRLQENRLSEADFQKEHFQRNPLKEDLEENMEIDVTSIQDKSPEIMMNEVLSSSLRRKGEKTKLDETEEEYNGKEKGGMVRKPHRSHMTKKVDGTKDMILEFMIPKIRLPGSSDQNEASNYKKKDNGKITPSVGEDELNADYYTMTLNLGKITSEEYYDDKDNLKEKVYQKDGKVADLSNNMREVFEIMLMSNEERDYDRDYEVMNREFTKKENIGFMKENNKPYNENTIREISEMSQNQRESISIDNIPKRVPDMDLDMNDGMPIATSRKGEKPVVSMIDGSIKVQIIKDTHTRPLSKKKPGTFAMHDQMSILNALAVVIPGNGFPGHDYPILSHIPFTNFVCSSDKGPGYFADTHPKAKCQVFHICQEDGRMDSFLCPNGTLFNQFHLVCDWWYNVVCEENREIFPKVDLEEIINDPYMRETDFEGRLSGNKDAVERIPENSIGTTLMSDRSGNEMSSGEGSEEENYNEKKKDSPLLKSSPSLEKNESLNEKDSEGRDPVLREHMNDKREKVPVGEMIGSEATDDKNNGSKLVKMNKFEASSNNTESKILTEDNVKSKTSTEEAISDKDDAMFDYPESLMFTEEKDKYTDNNTTKLDETNEEIMNAVENSTTPDHYSKNVSLKLNPDEMQNYTSNLETLSLSSNKTEILEADIETYTENISDESVLPLETAENITDTPQRTDKRYHSEKYGTGLETTEASTESDQFTSENYTKRNKYDGIDTSTDKPKSSFNEVFPVTSENLYSNTRLRPNGKDESVLKKDKTRPSSPDQKSDEGFDEAHFVTESQTDPTVSITNENFFTLPTTTEQPFSEPTKRGEIKSLNDSLTTEKEDQALEEGYSYSTPKIEFGRNTKTQLKNTEDEYAKEKKDEFPNNRNQEHETHMNKYGSKNESSTIHSHFNGNNNGNNNSLVLSKGEGYVTKTNGRSEEDNPDILNKYNDKKDDEVRIKDDFNSDDGLKQRNQNEKIKKYDETLTDNSKMNEYNNNDNYMKVKKEEETEETTKGNNGKNKPFPEGSKDNERRINVNKNGQRNSSTKGDRKRIDNTQRENLNYSRNNGNKNKSLNSYGISTEELKQNKRFRG